MAGDTTPVSTDAAPNLTLKHLSEQLQAGAVSSEALTGYFLDRINAQDESLNAMISVEPDRALESARAADLARQRGEAGPLTGLPMIHKDVFCTEGVKTTCGSRMLENFVSPYNATVVERLADAGMVMLGKANMDEFAMGSSNENSYFGAVGNPWNPDHVPGGSSGGSAAVVAARFAPASTGTDTGGSIRQPAAFCGITGIKPTYGRVSRYGLVAFASSLDQAGPMAQTAEDCAMLLGAMAGFDERDSTSIDRPVDDYQSHLSRPLDGLRVGVPEEYFAAGLDAAVGDAVMAGVETLKSLGATISSVSLPNQHLCVPAYYVVAPAEASSNLSRFDGVRYGYRCDNPVDLEDLYVRPRGEGFGREVKRRILIGTYALSAGYYDAYYLKAQQVRQLISQDYTKAFEHVDVIAGPATPTTAFARGAKVDDPVSMYLNDLYTISANLAGLPAVSFPCGNDKARLPIGLQLTGRYFAESTLLNAAHQYQQATDWHTHCPPDFVPQSLPAGV